jgi:hypothetical protein
MAEQPRTGFHGALLHALDVVLADIDLTRAPAGDSPNN